MEKVSFTIDAGIINRLGLELVAKSETAVAELVKNAYDADANTVKVAFENARQIGGILIIDDDGEGMNKHQLLNGFMRLATTDKIHNTVSNKYKRPKAGKKGIGRFSTQRLGKKLTVITQTKDSEKAYKLTINWDDYETDKEVHEIQNNLEQVERVSKESGTILTIEDLRDKWSIADIKRVYRYVSGLIQPNYLKIVEEGGNVKNSKEERFEALFLDRENNLKKWETIADPQTMIFDRALAVFNGYIDKNGFGHCTLKTKKFSIHGVKEILEEHIEVSNSIKNKNEIVPFENLIGSKVAFRVYYFIGGSRVEYYGINQMELNHILKHLDENGGLKLYRNGFRVAKYGDKGDDWAGMDKKNRIGQGVPFGNDRILGLVQITDAEGSFFEESAGREGLIEKEAFVEMQHFVSTAIEASFRRFVSWFKTTDEYKAANPDKTAPPTTESTEKIAQDLKWASQILSNPDSSEEDKVKATIIIKQATNQFISHTRAVVNELEMLRVLAGVGLTIAEFIHEVKQFVPSINGYIGDLLRQDIPNTTKEELQKMEKVVVSFLSYTAYFDATISQNIVRELKPIDLRDAVRRFEQSVEMDIKRRNFLLKTDFESHNLITTPMHPSEWNTILQNLYSNSKKAILKANPKQGKILIKCYKDKNNGFVYLSFYDNGIGIPLANRKRIFDAFYTTATPISSTSTSNLHENVGSGLGLYILKQIIHNRKGEIRIDEPIEDYSTCVTIKLPLEPIKA